MARNLFLALLLTVVFTLGGCSKSNSGGSSGGNAQLQIDDVLKRTDLSDEVREELELRKSTGTIKTLSQKSLDRLMSSGVAKRKDPVKPPVTTMRVRSFFAGNGNSLTGKIPTKSKTPFTPGPYVYRTVPEKYADRSRLLTESRLKGLAHFKKQTPYDVTPAGKASVEKLIDSIIRDMVKPNDKKRWESHAAEVVKLEKANRGLKQEPFFLMYSGVAHGRAENHAEAAQRLQRALEEFDVYDYPTLLIIENIQELFKYQANRASRAVKTDQFARYGVAMKYWLTEDFQMEPKHHPYAFTVYREFSRMMLLNQDWPMLTAVHDTVSGSTDLPPWLRLVIRGHYRQSKALYYRGSGMPDTVTKENWKYFEENVSMANGFYGEAYKIAPWLGDSSEQLMQLAVYGLSDASAEQWFEKALVAQPESYGLCTSHMMALLPQWGGSIEKMIQFSEAQAFKGCNNSLLPYLPVYCYYTIRNQALAEPEVKQEIVNSERVLKNIIRGLDLIINNIDENGLAVNGKIRDKNFFISFKAVFANTVGLTDIAQESFRRVGKKLDNDVLQIVGIRASSRDAYRARVHALTSEFESEANELNELMKGGLKMRLENSVRIIKLCDRVLKEAGDPVTAIYFSKARNRVAMESAFDRGDWVKQKFTKDFELWGSNEIKQIEFESENSVIIDNRNHYAGFRFSSAIQCPGSKIVEYDIEYPDAGQANSHMSNDLVPSLVAYITDADFKVFGVARDTKDGKLPGNDLNMRIGKLYVGSLHSRRNPAPILVSLPNRKVHFKFIIQPGYCEVYIDGEYVIRLLGAKDAEIKHMFEIAQPFARKGRAKFRLSNVKYKKWTSEPPPHEGPTDKVVTYYEELLAENKDDPWITFWLAKSYHRDDKFDKAIEGYKSAVRLGVAKSRVAFFLADAYERKGDLAVASKVYLAGAPANSMNVGIHLNRGKYMRSDLNWCSFRYAWLTLTSADVKVRQSYDESKYADPYPAGVNDWTLKLLEAQKLAIAGKFDEAKTMVQKVIVNCDSEQEKLVLPIIKAYSEGKPYVESKEPVYIKLDKLIPMFR